jgi:hypothetical protein
MLDLLLFIIIIVIEIIHYFERKSFLSSLNDKKEKSIPKARQSFVVRNMNEKLKNALFPNSNK